MIEINPMMIDQKRFLAIEIYLPKYTMKMLFNMRIICLDECFDIEVIEKRCFVPMVCTMKGSFEQMLNQPCTKVSKSALQLGIIPSMRVKEAILCAFQKENQ
ncbi:MAG: DUF1805 domain-containing protein [Erysipelotrichaceae bacterium]|nr:DUF1805 domain-containing protein [Erysipelotrichaceae bacterium]